MMPIVLRFLLGGVFVVIFSVMGESFKPKSFAGVFGAAPSIAIAGLILSFKEHGSPYTSLMVHSMSYGAVALLVYCVSLEILIRRTPLAPWFIAFLLWGEWLFVSIGLYTTVLR